MNAPQYFQFQSDAKKKLQIDRDDVENHEIRYVRAFSARCNVSQRGCLAILFAENIFDF